MMKNKKMELERYITWNLEDFCDDFIAPLLPYAVEDMDCSKLIPEFICEHGVHVIFVIDEDQQLKCFKQEIKTEYDEALQGYLIPHDRITEEEEITDAIKELIPLKYLQVLQHYMSAQELIGGQHELL